jgi:tetratricopeptide (TPR) repeat protein
MLSNARTIDLYQQSLARFQQLGDQSSVALVLINLGFIAREQADYVRATDLYQQSLKLSQQLGFQLARCHNYLDLGWVAFMQGVGKPALGLEKPSHR